MTCITFRDGVAAADGRVLDLWTPAGSSPKIARRGRLIFGAVGESAYVRVFNDWVRSEAFNSWLDGSSERPDLVRADKSDRETNGVLFLPDNSCIRFECNSPPYRVRAPYFAFGTGAPTALGAMFAGADAATAVRAASLWDIGTGPLETVLRMDEA